MILLKGANKKERELFTNSVAFNIYLIVLF